MPTLWPQMMLPWVRREALPYPFEEPGAHYLYSTRNGIYTVARMMGLAGQEVLFPAYFCGVELDALLAAGVRPRFFPVHGRMRIDPDEVAAQIGPETKAIYLIHYAGFPGPVEELKELCRNRGLRLIEDCALALLSCLGAKPLGSFGEAAVFCLYKTLPAPNGGVVLLRGGEPVNWLEGQRPSLTSLAARLVPSLLMNLEMRGSAGGRLLRQGVVGLGKAAVHTAGTERVGVGTQEFDPSHVGLGMSDCSRVVLKAQDFPAITGKRRNNYSHLLERLRGLSTPIFGELPPGVCPLFYPLQVRNKKAVHAELMARGVEAINFWSLHHPLLPPGVFPEVDELRQTVLWLPCHQDLTESAIDRLAAVMHEVVREVN